MVIYKLYCSVKVVFGANMLLVILLLKKQMEGSLLLSSTLPIITKLEV